MKKILIMRHAKSDRSIECIHDIERPLIERGYRDAAIIAEELLRLNFAPGLILTSPAVRAYSTALVVANHIKFKLTNIKLQPTLYFAGYKSYLANLSDIEAKVDTVLIVGHNPDLENLVSKVDSTWNGKIATSGLCIFEADIKSWKELEYKKCQLKGILQPAGLRNQNQPHR